MLSDSSFSSASDFDHKTCEYCIDDSCDCDHMSTNEQKFLGYHVPSDDDLMYREEIREPAILRKNQKCRTKLEEMLEGNSYVYDSSDSEEDRMEQAEYHKQLVAKYGTVKLAKSVHTAHRTIDSVNTWAPMESAIIINGFLQEDDADNELTGYVHENLYKRKYPDMPTLGHEEDPVSKENNVD